MNLSISSSSLLIFYSGAVALASFIGGTFPMLFKVAHRRMQFMLSFISGIMLSVSLFDLLPQAIELTTIQHSMYWLLTGFLVIFFAERFFCFHHHDQDVEEHSHDACDHAHSSSWIGAAVGLTIHCVLCGVALGAVVGPDAIAQGFVGLGTFLIVVLHKPFDSLTIVTLMRAGHKPQRLMTIVNALFALTVPLGALLYVWGLSHFAGDEFEGLALAFSSGMFLCIALSDLLPELQFHQHDRWGLSFSLLFGLFCGWLLASLEHVIG